MYVQVVNALLAVLLAASASAEIGRDFHGANVLPLKTGGFAVRQFYEDFEGRALISKGEIAGYGGWRFGPQHVVNTNNFYDVAVVTTNRGQLNSSANNRWEYRVYTGNIPVAGMTFSVIHRMTGNLGSNPVQISLVNGVDMSGTVIDSVAWQVNTTGSGNLQVLDKAGFGVGLMALSGNTSYTYAVAVDSNGFYTFSVDGVSKRTGYMRHDSFDRILFACTNTVNATAVAQFDNITLSAAPALAGGRMGFK